MKREKDIYDFIRSLPDWDDLSPSEKVDVIALPFLIPALLSFMYYLTVSL
jgi:hypothetical protein